MHVNREMHAVLLGAFQGREARLHLHQELGLDAPAGLALALAARAAQRVNLRHSSACTQEALSY